MQYDRVSASVLFDHFTGFGAGTIRMYRLSNVRTSNYQGSSFHTEIVCAILISKFRQSMAAAS